MGISEPWLFISTLHFVLPFHLSITDSNPDKVYPEWYSVLMASWIFFGLAWLSLVINHSIDILERLNTHFKQWWSGRMQEEDYGSAMDDGPDTQVDKEDKMKKPTITQ